MKRQVQSGLKIYLLLVITFSLYLFGCGGEDKAKVQVENVEDKQLMESHSMHSSEEDEKEDSTIGMYEPELASVSDQIQSQFENLKPFVDELKTETRTINEGAEQAR